MRRLSVGRTEPDRLHQALAGDVGTGRRISHEIALRRLEDAEDEVVGGEQQAAQISDRLAFPTEPGGLVPGGSRSVLELALVDAGPVALGRVEHAGSWSAPYGCVPQSMYRGITFVIGPSRRRCRPSRRIVASAYLSPFWSRNTIRLPSGANEPAKACVVPPLKCVRNFACDPSRWIVMRFAERPAAERRQAADVRAVGAHPEQRPRGVGPAAHERYPPAVRRDVGVDRATVLAVGERAAVATGEVHRPDVLGVRLVVEVVEDDALAVRREGRVAFAAGLPGAEIGEPGPVGVHERHGAEERPVAMAEREHDLTSVR